MTRKAFLTGDLLLTLFVMTLLMTLCVSGIRCPDLSWSSFADAYLRELSSSYTLKKAGGLEGYPVTFNEAGVINLGNTFSFEGRNVIVHLGNGFLTVE